MWEYPTSKKKDILLAVAMHQTTGETFTSRTIAEVTGACKETSRLYLKALWNDGLITKQGEKYVCCTATENILAFNKP